MSIDFPDMIKVSDVQKDENGNIILAGTLDDKGKLALPPIRIDAFDLTGVDLSNGKDVMCKIILDGTIRMTDASLDVNKWFGKELNVGFKSVISEIQIDRLTGKVEYKVDPVVETVDLGDFAGHANVEVKALVQALRGLHGELAALLDHVAHVVG